MSADVNYLAEMTTNYIVVKRKKPNSKLFFINTNLIHKIRPPLSN